VVYTSVAIRNARASTAGREVDLRAGLLPHFQRASTPRSTLAVTRVPAHDEPTLVWMTKTPASRACANMTRIVRSRRAAGDPLRSLRTHIRDQLGRMLAGGGFDPAADITAITVNAGRTATRRSTTRCGAGAAGSAAAAGPRRARFGRIAIANSDSGGGAYTTSPSTRPTAPSTELLGSSRGA